jgi:hypothetical protein
MRDQPVGGFAGDAGRRAEQVPAVAATRREFGQADNQVRPPNVLAKPRAQQPCRDQ